MDKLIQSAQEICAVFRTLNLTNKFVFDCDGVPSTLAQLLRDKASDVKPGDSTMVAINGKHFELSCLPNEDQTSSDPNIHYYKIECVEPPINDETLTTFTNTIFGMKENTSVPYIRVQSGEKFLDLGGPDKEELYASHLDVIQSIIQHISDPQALATTINNILIAYPTGSGKTFIQALWFLILYHAGVSGVFTTADNLIAPFIKDFKRLLPNEMVNLLLPISDSAPSSEPRYYIGSHRELLSTYFLNFENMDNVVFAIDEAHKAVEVEALKLALHKLGEDKLCMFLTATPNEAIYQSCGSKPVAIMPQKAFSDIHVVHAKSQNDYRKESNSGMAFAMTIADVLEPLQASTAASLQNQLPFIIGSKTIAGPEQSSERQARWNFVPMMSRKTLAFASENVDDLINIHCLSHSHHPVEYDVHAFYTEDMSNEYLNAIKERHAGRPGTLLVFKHPYYIDGARCYFVDDDGKDQYAYKHDMYYLDQTGEWRKLSPQLDFIESKELTEALGKAESGRQMKVAVDNILNRKLKPEELLTNLYHDGNSRKREFGLFAARQTVTFTDPSTTHGYIIPKDVDCDHAKAFLDKKQSKFDAATPECLRNNKDIVIPQSLNESLDNVVFHGLNEILIRAVLAYDPDSQTALMNFKKTTTIDLNAMRFKDLPGLTAKFAEKLESLKHSLGAEQFKTYLTNLLSYHQSNNQGGIDKAGAEDAAHLITRMYVNTESANSTLLKKIVDNWNLDRSFQNHCELSDNFKRQFATYADDHRTLYVMSGMEEAETPIQDGRPFRKFKSFPVYLKNKNGMQSEAAKKRSLNTIEFFDPNASEIHFQPEYCDADINEDVADNYFKLGLVGMYVSNRKSEGFNDPNLQNLVSIVSSNGDKNNQPTQVVQQIGRNRHFDPTQIPMVAQCYAEGAKPVLDASALKHTKDFLPLLFKSEKIYHQYLNTKLGENLAESIQSWFIRTSDGKEQVKPELFRGKILRSMLENLRVLNNHNDHQLDATKSDYAKTISVAQNSFSNMIGKLKKSISMTFTVRMISFVTNFIMAFFSLRRISTAISFYFKAAKDKKRLQTLADNDPELPKLRLHVAYAKVIRAHSMQETYTHSFIGIAAARLMMRKLNVINASIIEDPVAVMKEDVKTDINDIIVEYILPLLVKFYPKEVQTRFLATAKQHTGWEIALSKHLSLLRELGNMNDSERSQSLGKLAHAFFAEIPELQSELKNIQQIDYVANTSAIVAYFKDVSETMFNDHSLLEKDLQPFFQNEFLSSLQQLLPYQYAELVTSILKSDANAAEFARSITRSNRTLYMSPEKSFDLFKNCFQDRYTELKAISSMQAIKDNAMEKVKSISRDIRDIIANSIELDDEEEKPAPTTRLGALKQSFAAKSRIARSAIKFVTKRNQIKSDLAVYFNTDFLAKLREVLPSQEYTILHSIFSNTHNAELFAAYLLTHARSISKADLSDFTVVKGYLTDCFKKSPIRNSLEHFRGPAELEASNNTVMEKLKKNITDIADKYIAIKMADIRAQLISLLTSRDFALKLAEFIQVSGSGVNENELPEDVISRLMNQPAHPNASSAVDLLMKNIQSLSHIKEELSANNITYDALPIGELLTDHFSTEQTQDRYKFSFLPQLGKQGFNALANIQNDFAQLIDDKHLSNLTATHLLDALLHPEYVKLFSFYLKDLDENDLVAIFQNQNKNTINPPSLDAYKQQAREMLRLHALLLANDREAITTEFLTILPLNTSFDEDLMQQKLESVRMYHVLQNFNTLSTCVTEWQAYYHQTNPKGGTRTAQQDLGFDDNNNIFSIRVPKVVPNSLADDMWQLMLLQGQVKSAAAQNSLNAFADAYTINTFQRVKDYVIQPFNQIFNASTIGLYFKRALASIASLFSKQPEPVAAQDKNMAEETATIVRRKQPQTWSKVRHQMDKRRQDSAYSPPSDALESTVRKVDRMTSEQTKQPGVANRTSSLFTAESRPLHPQPVTLSPQQRV